MIDRESLRIRERRGLLMCRRLGLKKVDAGRIGKAGTTPCPCSCWMCGNPRRHLRGREGLTIQELREFQDGRLMREILERLE